MKKFGELKPGEIFFGGGASAVFKGIQLLEFEILFIEEQEEDKVLITFREVKSNFQMREIFRKDAVLTSRASGLTYATYPEKIYTFYINKCKEIIKKREEETLRIKNVLQDLTEKNEGRNKTKVLK